MIKILTLNSHCPKNNQNLRITDGTDAMFYVSFGTRHTSNRVCTVCTVYKNQTYCTVYRGIHSNRNRFRISAEFQIIFGQFSTVQYL